MKADFFIASSKGKAVVSTVQINTGREAEDERVLALWRDFVLHAKDGFLSRWAGDGDSIPQAGDE